MQFHEANKTALTRNVGQYIWEGLSRGEGVLVIAAAESCQMFSRRLESLGADLPALLASRQLVLWDAEAILAEVMCGGQPDWGIFEERS